MQHHSKLVSPLYLPAMFLLHTIEECNDKISIEMLLSWGCSW